MSLTKTASPKNDASIIPVENITFGRRIAKLRVERGVTLRVVAEAAGVTPAAVSRWEAYDTIPRFDTLGRLAGYFGVSTTYLRTGQSDDLAGSVDAILDQAKREIASLTGLSPEALIIEVRYAR